MEKYTIDLDTILQILGGFHQNGLLQSDLPTKRVGNKTPWKAHLRLIEGKLASCSILDEKGMVVQEGESALKMLRKGGQLDWFMFQDPNSVTEQQQASRQERVTGNLSPNFLWSDESQQRAFAGPPVPRRLINVSSEQMSQGRWPRSYRLVYAMINGINTIEAISHLLTMPVWDVEQIIRDLQRMRIIL